MHILFGTGPDHQILQKILINKFQKAALAPLFFLLIFFYHFTCLRHVVTILLKEMSVSWS